MAIIGIISTIAAFSWQRYVTNANLRTAARDVASDILLFKERAVAESIQYRLTFNVGANNYTIDQGTAAGAPFTVMQTKTPTTFGSGLSLQGATFSGAQVVFLSRGTLGSGTGAVTLKNSRNSTATVTVNITGKTSVQFAMQ